MNVEKIVVSPVEHFSGARRTRTTWQATLVMGDGREVKCGHYMHRTTEAATACGRRLSRVAPHPVTG